MCFFSSAVSAVSKRSKIFGGSRNAFRSSILFAQIKIVQAVEPDFVIVGAGQNRLPGLPVLLHGIHGRGLDDEQPRAVALPIAAL